MPGRSTSQCEGNEDKNFVPPLDQEACDFWLGLAQRTHFDIYVLKLKYMEGSGNWEQNHCSSTWIWLGIIFDLIDL